MMHSIRLFSGFLIYPIELREFIVQHLALAEPESDFLLCVLDAVGAVADIAADVLYVKKKRRSRGQSFFLRFVLLFFCCRKGFGGNLWKKKGRGFTYDCIIASDGARGRGEWVSGAE